jgi:hypothetical protein
MVGPLREGQNNRPTIRREAGQYSTEELRALLVITKDSSNRDVVAKLIQQSLQKQTDAVTKLVGLMTQFLPKLPAPVRVEVDGNPIATAGGNASDRRRK